jgi:hypothetical protein
MKRHARSLAWTLRNAAAGRRIRAELVRRGRPLADVARYERHFASQNGEDGILEALLAIVGTGSRTFVEFGAGSRCNALTLARRG